MSEVNIWVEILKYLVPAAIASIPGILAVRKQFRMEKVEKDKTNAEADKLQAETTSEIINQYRKLLEDLTMRANAMQEELKQIEICKQEIGRFKDSQLELLKVLQILIEGIEKLIDQLEK